MTNTQIARTDHNEQRLLDILKDAKMQNAIRNALPEHVRPERVMRMLTTAVRATPKLALCHPGSFIGSVLQVTQLGLEVNTPLGHAFLVPFWSSREGVHIVTPIIGYKGILELAHRSGQLAAIGARVARQGDEFSYTDSFEPDFKFVRRATPDAPLTYAWCFGSTIRGGRFLEVLTREDVMARKARSAAVKGKRGSPWMTDEAAMWRKTAVRAAQWQLPQSAEMQRAEALARAEDGDTALVDAFDPAISDLLDQANMLPPEPDRAPAEDAPKDSKDNDLTA